MIAPETLVAFMLVLARVSAFIAFFPLFSQKQLPNLVKVGLSAALAIFWIGEVEVHSLPADGVDSLSVWSLSFLTFKEASIGVALAIAMGLFFWPAKVAGSYVGQELGLSLASISDPGSQDGSTLVSRLFETFAVLLFFVGNVHHFIILVLHVSFNRLSTDTGLNAIPTESLVSLLSNVCGEGLLIAGPVLILSMLMTLILAALNRAAPALNLFSVGMSMRSGLGVLCLAVFCPVFLAAANTHMGRVRENIEDLLMQLFHG
ncbi:flagellar biosynthetic protein FliR [Stieleria varia]|uniref:Flagellar biosynthesis protein FliR n=1 Tax=Stieleria varia TaxID=2528005 RepID=A0A5C6ASD3_9BACT|nr:flagellar biosynthetic protein FliR [Stieleria varia]TWU02179.1 flagellar biosynthesis protein FliR [Stieleria varia]